MSNQLSTTGSQTPAPLSGKTYFLYGSGLMVLKYFVDVALATLVFHSTWSFLDYLIPASAMHVGAAGPYIAMYLSMLSVAMPFACIGCILTVRRLRAADLPVWLVLMFFLPVINLFFFLMLCFVPNVIPAEQGSAAAELPSPQRQAPEQLPLDRSTAAQNLHAPEQSAAQSIDLRMPPQPEPIPAQPRQDLREAKQEAMPAESQPQEPGLSREQPAKGDISEAAPHTISEQARFPAAQNQASAAQKFAPPPTQHASERINLVEDKDVGPSADKLAVKQGVPPDDEEQWSLLAKSSDPSGMPAVDFRKPKEEPEPLLAVLIPEDDKQAFWVAAFTPIIPAIALAAFAVFVLGGYGWGLFVGVPFAVSIASPLLFAYRKQRTLWECMKVSSMSLFMIASVLLLIPFEGVICLAMASPMIFAIGAVGAVVAWVVQHRDRELPRLPSMLGCFLVLVPAVMAAEAATCQNYPLYELSSVLDINAPPHKVWKNLIDFPPLSPPDEAFFKVGIAYPIKATIDGHGPGAVRRCVFSTGAFVEPITVWDEPRQLKFGVRSQPDPMHEMSMYPNLHPRHLNSYLVTKNGQFLLEPLAGGRCRLIGTTWYENRMGPGPYWKAWSDMIIHSIHMRVLNHVRNLSEQPELTLKN